VVSLVTGLEDIESVTVALLVAVGAAETGRPTLMFLTKEAVRLAQPGFADGVGCSGCPPIADLMRRHVVRVPGLLERTSPAGQRTHRQRRDRRHSSDVGMDRR
jgi:hypothetical protein